MELGVREVLPVVCKMMSFVSFYEKRLIFHQILKVACDRSPLNQVWAGWEKFCFQHAAFEVLGDVQVGVVTELRAKVSVMTVR